MNFKIILFVYLIGIYTVHGYSQNMPTAKKIDKKSLSIGSEIIEEYSGNNPNSINEALLYIFRNKENLYIQTDKTNLSEIKKKFGEEVQQSIKTADEVRDHYFLFRYEWDMEKTKVPYQFKGDIDWQINPFGDPEWTYMLNRHRYWIDLGKAYYLTGKEKYAKTLVKQMEHWIVQNPLKKDYKQTSWRRIEAGIRAENWIKSFELIKNSKHVTPDFIQTFLNALYVHAEYLNESFDSFSQTSNWGVLEYHGLFNIAMFMPEFKKSKIWKKNAIENLSICLQNQILEDGTQWEQSPMYHNEVFHSALNVLLLANRFNEKLPENIINKIEAMAFANISWQKPNFHQPLLGDSDDTNLKGLLTTAGILLNSQVIKSRGYNDIDYGNFFLFTREERERYKELIPEKPDFLSVYQNSSGNFISRSSWEENAYYSTFHLKNLGGGHSHDDLLHFTLFANKKDYLIDAGRYTYVNNEWREYFKNSFAHNSLAVDHKTNNEYAGSWTNSYEAKTEGIYTNIEENFDYAEAINTAYLRLEDPVLVKRQMLYLKPDIWLLIDSFKGAKEEHTYSQYFNFPNNLVTSGENHLITSYDENNLIIKALNPVEIELENEWMSPEYNDKKEILRAELSRKKTGFASFLSLFYFQDNDVKFKKVSVRDKNGNKLPDTHAEAVEIIDGDTTYIIVIAHRATNGMPPFLRIGENSIVGEFILITRQNGKEEIQIIK